MPTIHSDSITISSDMAIVSPDMPTVHSDSILVSSDTVTVSADMPTVHSDIVIVSSETVTVSADMPTVHSDMAIVSPDMPTVHSDIVIVSPDMPTVHSDIVIVSSDTVIVCFGMPAVHSDLTTVRLSIKSEPVRHHVKMIKILSLLMQVVYNTCDIVTMLHEYLGYTEPCAHLKGDYCSSQFKTIPASHSSDSLCPFGGLIKFANFSQLS